MGFSREKVLKIRFRHIGLLRLADCGTCICLSWGLKKFFKNDKSQFFTIVWENIVFSQIVVKHVNLQVSGFRFVCAFCAIPPKKHISHQFDDPLVNSHKDAENQPFWFWRYLQGKKGFLKICHRLCLQECFLSPWHGSCFACVLFFLSDEPPNFSHYTGCLTGSLMIVYYDPRITG